MDFQIQLNYFEYGKLFGPCYLYAGPRLVANIYYEPIEEAHGKPRRHGAHPSCEQWAAEIQTISSQQIDMEIICEKSHDHVCRPQSV
jgi:hypothetical protein